MTCLLAGCRTILGAGTDRFCVPLLARDFEPLGVDLSREMLRRSRAKAVSRLVRADLRRLRPPDKVVDAALMAHVLQLLLDPGPVLRELGRVACRRVVVPDGTEPPERAVGRDRLTRYPELAAELGYSLLARGYRRTMEDLSAMAYPRAIVMIHGCPLLDPTPEERRTRWGAWMCGRGGIPPDVHAEILRRLGAELPIGTAAGTASRTERPVAWDLADLVTAC